MNFLRKIKFFFLYLGDPPWDTGVSPPELMDFIQNHPPGKALDLGCGTGTNVITLAKNGWETTGIDFVSKAIKTARKKAQQSEVNVSFYSRDVAHLENLDGNFNLVLDIGCLHSLSEENRQSYILSLGRLLAPGGFYLLYAFCKPSEESSAPGLADRDVELISAQLNLINKVTGTDRSRISTWFTFEKPGEIA